MAIPGTHHSMITHVKGFCSIFSAFAVCQELTLTEQFNLGVRFFQVGLGDDVEGGTIYAKHRFPAKPVEPGLWELRHCLETNKK
jgi:hypothetical protein